ncbi:hypothetical protein KIH86_25080 [Paenibacillus sp. HN-1]|uniref:hypothetical protein n=1 Tax=Paenibacillus TaxID=44249 RepID=UPI001CA8D9CF|nr:MULTISPECIES: hypothetical protein [Paenibacillus]MBY9077426.1 hypothetical protein [Paenibacillus sp. CGMCC 1.18879]MBY9087465.1 hypothetical protein [Paenibacillus sinensis]
MGKEAAVPRTPRERQRQLIVAIAEEAAGLPLLEGGLWFHDDVRNNFYYASYLFAAAKDHSLDVTFDRIEAAVQAESVLERTLLLQNRVPGTKLFGHWPLGLAPVPAEAPPHELPVEIMGSLMAYFRKRYGDALSERVRTLLDSAIGHVYASVFFRKPLEHYGHHEAKYTAAKLIFGSLFDDRELLEDGRACLKETLRYIRESGMPEYGSLPWFWHWVQAYTCALEMAPESDDDLRRSLKDMLDYLWGQRALFHLKGAWVGAHSRGWPHDVPGDANVLHDYVQFGDFALPGEMPRTEYAGFLYYEAPEAARVLALDRSQPAEVKKATRKVVPGGPAQPELHSYAYIAEDYAAGGLWERVDEFDNEQLRWAYSLPVKPGRRVNRLYFFPPGDGYHEGDPRHQSRHMEVLYRRNMTAALFTGPDGSLHPVGVLPPGTWLAKPRALYGVAAGVYFAVYLSGEYGLTERSDYTEVNLCQPQGGVVVEALGAAEAAASGIAGLENFAEAMETGRPVFEWDGAAIVSVTWDSSAGERIFLAARPEGPYASVDGVPVSFEDYSV